MELATVGILVVGVLVTALLIGAGIVAYGSLVKNDWGVNLHPVICPKCNTELTYVKAPKTRRQMLWGGCTCPKCACEVDKWGQPTAERGASSLDGRRRRDGLVPNAFAPLFVRFFSIFMPLYRSQESRVPLSFARLLRREVFFFAPVLYIVLVALEARPTLQDRLLRPIPSVILITFIHALINVGAARAAKRRVEREGHSSTIGRDPA